MSKDYRKFKRVKPNVKIDMYDIIKSQSLGEVLNISIGGALIVSSLEINAGEMFQTEWQLSARGMKSIAVGIECLWVDIQHSGHRFCGLHIIDISEDDLKILERIIAQSKEI